MFAKNISAEGADGASDLTFAKIRQDSDSSNFSLTSSLSLEKDDLQELDLDDISSNDENYDSKKNLVKRYRLLNLDTKLHRKRVLGENGLKTVKRDYQLLRFLFHETKDSKILNNVVHAIDSEVLLNVTENAEISIKNLKVDHSNKIIDVNDFLINFKRKFSSLHPQSDISNEYSDFDNDFDDHDHDGSDSFYGVHQNSNNKKYISLDDHHPSKKSKENNKKKPAKTSRNTNKINFLRVGTASLFFSKKAPTIDFLNTTMNVKKKRFKQHQINDLPNGEKITADKLTLDDLKNTSDLKKDDTAKSVHLCYKVFQKYTKEHPNDKKINIFNFFINPKSFSKTVENMFYMSFLVKDNKIRINFNNDSGFPTVEEVVPLSKLDNQDSRYRSEKKLYENDQVNHIVFRLDYESWEKLIKIYNIQDSII
ncbi:Smc5-Smc6 complex subunit NSE4 ASCRUDRAFT_14593 [Ascoidea rubescens DSM 1968]|uniref:Non-structural maintenance of chromosomes element 4 n=1 Tax=Ascoidea rubescens DSM 1968 TaxID=1344418 RepID=A0A1D2VCW4_9ASCO|nr:hypothetical protein ASCRUDRAFT_14593 [Ascoidea rubescens DSM 1968]ODV59538.1 hypothetical protein ASCRUDRAFT_14593 [Ascoidea rubescens DSM 1968]